MSDKETLKKKQLIQISAFGDLSIAGGNELAATGEDVNIDEQDGLTAITCYSDLSVYVPAYCRVVIVQASGDVSVMNLSAPLTATKVFGDMTLMSIDSDSTIESVSGDLACRQVQGVQIADVYGDMTLRGAGNVQIGTVHGDLSAHGLSGGLLVKNVMGDAVIRDVAGDVTVEQTAGDASVRGLAGSNNRINSSDDIRISGPLFPGHHTFRAASDIVLRWPEDEPIVLTVKANRITNRLELEDEASTAGALAGHIGKGGPEVVLDASGRVVIKSDKSRVEWDASVDIDLEGIGERISAEINARMSELSSRMSQFSTMFDADTLSRFERKAESAASKAEKALEKAMKRMEQRMERAEKGSWRPPTPPPPPSTATPPRKPQPKDDTRAEQMQILKMLQDGKISVEDANKLLDALS